MKIALYASNHGFGHGSRVAALAQSLIDFGCYIYICCDRPLFLFQELSDTRWEYRETKIDRGVVHKANLVTDLEKTKAALMDLFSRREELVRNEVLFLRENAIDLVLSDIPFLIAEACSYAEVPVFGISNFDWYFIYNELFAEDAEMIPILSVIYSLYRRMDCSFLLDMGSPSSVPGFKNPRAGGLIARTQKQYRDVYNKYGIKKGRKILLLMFGGEGTIDVPIRELCEAWDGIVISPCKGISAPNLLVVNQDDDFISLIKHSDLIICKPGYSTFAEVMSMGKSMIYIPRKNYPEERVLIDSVRNYPGALLVDALPNKVGEIRKLFALVAQGDFARKADNVALSGKIINELIKLRYPKDRVVSVCDLGSNNMNYLLYNKSRNTVIHRYWCTTSLGMGFCDGKLSDISITGALDAIKDILDVDACIKSEKRLIATGVSRLAENSDVLLSAIAQRWQFKTKVISAKTEMKYSWLAARDLMLQNSANITLDIGGASTEIAWETSAGKHNGLSLPFGLINLYKNSVRGISVDQIVLKELNNLPCFENIRLIVVGLTATILLRYIRKTDVARSLAANGERLEKTDLARLIRDISQAKVHEYQGISESTREVASMGIAARIVQLVLDRYSGSYFVVCNDGISIGYAKWMK